jgi:glycosyltransferase involved in cell wall biosynthesis
LHSGPEGGDVTGESHGLHILCVTNLFPLPNAPAFGTFVGARVDQLRLQGVPVDVVSVDDARVRSHHGKKYVRLLAGTARAAWRLRAAPDRRDMVVEAHIAYPTGLVALLAAGILRAPLVLFAHGSDVLVLPRRRQLERRLATWLFRRADLVIANSEFLAGHVREMTEKVLVISPGIPVGALPPLGSPRPIDVLYVGRLVPDKGVHVLMRALAGHQLKVVVAGDGPARAELEDAASEHAIDVEFLGAVPPATAAALMEQAKCVAVPSVWDEPLGLVPLEAMSHGAVVVATATGGMAETVQDGVNAFVAERGDSESLRAAVQRALVLRDDPDALAELIDAGYAMAQRHEISATVRESVSAMSGLR